MTQNKMLIADGKILYSVVKEAIKEAGYSLQSKSPNSVLVWYDNLRETDFYSTLKPWQVVNRIPFINLICRKAPFIQLMNRMKVFFPSLYTFYPVSMILPVCNNQFQRLVSNHDKKYIVKPDNGSLGCGITILTKNSIFKPIKNLCVAQEYIDSYLINETKFDLRVYALVSSVTPLTIYVYHDGVARFCSEKSTVNSIFSQLTNTAVNRNNPNAKIESITKTIAEVFQILERKEVDTSLIWSKIENAVILTILPALNYMKFGVSQKDLSKGYNRCFQILGFDFILDTDLNPFILEVNYRPSLDADTEAERKLKTKMLGTAMHIGAPLETLQKIINENNEIVSFSKEKWDIFFKKASEKYRLIDKSVDTGLFNLVYPSKSAENTKTYNEVLNIVNRCPTKLTPHYKLPVPLKKPDPSLLPKVNPIVFYSNCQEIDDSHKQANVKPNQKDQDQQKLLDKNNAELNLIQNDQQKNLAILKHACHDRNNQGEVSSKNIISENSDIDDNLYVRKIIKEIGLMNELSLIDPKTGISICKQTPEQKNTSHTKAVVSNKSQNTQATSNSQKNIAKSSNISNTNAKINEKVQVVKTAEEEKTLQSNPSNTIDSTIPDSSQKGKEGQNQNINEINAKEVAINTAKSKESISKKSDTVQKCKRTRRSASTRPITRTIASTEQSKVNNSIKNYHNIEKLSNKYIEIITDQIKHLNNTTNLNPKQTKSSKVSKRNSNTIKPSTDYPAILEAESSRAQPPRSSTATAKTKKVIKKTSALNENLKSSEQTKAEPEKQPQQKQPVSIKTNLSQNTLENLKSNEQAKAEPEKQPQQKQPVSIKANLSQNALESLKSNEQAKAEPEKQPQQKQSVVIKANLSQNALENLKSNEQAKAEPEKQPQQKQPVSIKANLNQNVLENSKVSTVKEAVTTTQEIGTRIRLKPKPYKTEKNSKQNEIEINKLKIEENAKIDQKQNQETAETKQKQKIESRVVNDPKLKNQYKLKSEYETKSKVDSKPELISKSKSNATDSKIETANKLDSQLKTIKNDSKPEPLLKQQENKYSKTAELEKVRITKTDSKSKIETDKSLKTEPKSKKETVSRNSKTEPETKKVLRFDPKPKMEYFYHVKNIKTDFQEKNNIISEKDQKIVKNELKSKQEVELTTKSQQIIEKEEIIRYLMKRAENQKQKNKELK